MDDLNIEDGVLVRDANVGCRKKQKKVSARELAKKRRHSLPAGSNVFTPCTHNKPAYQCCKVRPQDALDFRAKIYKHNEKMLQDQMISRFISLTSVKQHRSRLEQPKKVHRFAAEYKVPVRGGTQIKVCKQFFLHVTKASSDRVRQIIKKLNSGAHFVENRGGDRVSQKSVAKKESVRQFLGNLRGTESHYNRKKSKRIYLQSDLSIKKLHTIYSTSITTTDLQVTLSMFRKVLCGEFNVGFKSPASDVCGHCTLLDNKIKAASSSDQKANLFMQKRLHKVRAKAFYQLIRENKEGELTLCFDMQQVQPLPRTPIQQAFYKRQIGLYNLCIMDVNNSNDPTFYVWTEDRSGRGSTEVASGMLNHLRTLDLTNINHLRLFCDGCGAQNKNNHVLHALMYFLAQHTGRMNKISIIFPVRGHSFLPADRCFGRVERLLRKKPTIIHKAGYFEELQKVGKVKQLGQDWHLMDVKSLESHLRKLDMIRDKKKIVIEKKKKKSGRWVIHVTGNEFFRFEADLQTHTLLKRNSTWQKILRTPLTELPMVHPISTPKKKDVDELLTIMFDDKWKDDEAFSWYKSIVDGEIPAASENEESEEVVLCDCLEHDDAIHI